jgi:hypothetical protein
VSDYADRLELEYDKAVAERDRLQEARRRDLNAWSETVAQRDRLQAIVDRAAAAGGNWFARAITAEAERDRLRAVVERAHDHVGVDEHVLRTLTVDDLVALVAVLRRDCAAAFADHAHLVEINAALRTRPDLAERAPLVVALAAERDRLRAVAADVLPFLRGVTDCLRESDGGPLDAWSLADETAAVYRALAGAVDDRVQLDVSPTGEDT